MMSSDREFKVVNERKYTINIIESAPQIIDYRHNTRASFFQSPVATAKNRRALTCVDKGRRNSKNFNLEEPQQLLDNKINEKIKNKMTFEEILKDPEINTLISVKIV
jgi:hypothetical protein